MERERERERENTLLNKTRRKFCFLLEHRERNCYVFLLLLFISGTELVKFQRGGITPPTGSGTRSEITIFHLPFLEWYVVQTP